MPPLHPETFCCSCRRFSAVVSPESTASLKRRSKCAVRAIVGSVSSKVCFRSRASISAASKAIAVPWPPWEALGSMMEPWSPRKNGSKSSCGGL